MNRKPAIDENLVVDGLLFATPGHRCRYLGTLNSEKPRWLEEHKGGYRRLEDVLPESAQRPQPDNVEISAAGPNCETSSHNIREDGGDNDHLSLVSTLPEYPSPSCQPTALSAPMNENLPNGSTQTELHPRAKSATSETTEPKTDATLLGTMGCKPDRSGGRGRKQQKLPEKISQSDRKPSPESMRLVLDTLRKCPILRSAAGKTGFHRKTLERWIKCSRAGHDGYDVEWQGFTWRLHEAYEVAVDEARETLEGNLLDLATEVIFKTDPSLAELGRQGEDAYATDEYGNFIPEAFRIRKKRLALIWLSRKRPETWGKPPKRRKKDISLNGEVLVIGQTTDKPQYNTTASVRARKWKALSRMVRETKA